MISNLADRLKNVFYAGATVATVGFGSLFYGCDSKTPIEPNNPPTASLRVSPTFGVNPLSVSIKGECTDPDGQGDIASYKVMNGTQVLTTQNPTDLERVLTENSSFKLECVDKAGNKVIKGPINVTVLNPSATQTVSLEEPVDINYSARVVNAADAQRRTYRDGELVGTKTIPGGVFFSEVIERAHNGDYEFILLNDTARVSVPIYPIEAPDLSGLEGNLTINEGDSLIANLPRATAVNPEFSPVQYLSVRSLDGKTNPSIGAFPQDSILKIKTIPDSLGTYQIELEFGNDDAGIQTATLGGEVQRFVGTITFARWLNDQEDINSGDIIFSDGNYELINIQNLTNHSSQDLEPAWSPDGSEILFTSHRTGGTAVWRMNVDGSNQRDITSHLVERARQADWCSSGLIAVAYRDKNDSEAGIGIVDPNANSFTPVYTESRSSRIPGWPSWSPSCNEIAFQKYVNGNWEIFTINADGSSLMNLTNDSELDQQPAWNPVNSNIAFISDKEGGLSIYSIDLGTKNVERITQSKDYDPSWSFDGKTIIFTSERDSGYHLYQKNILTREVSRLTFDGASLYPTWKPN